MKLMSLLPLFGALMLQGSSTGGVRIWKASEIHSRGEALAKKLDANKVASEAIATDGNRSFSIAHREGSGQSEQHDLQADVLYITEGEITMVYGGSIVGGTTTAPGETRGTAISGGTDVKLGAGDILHIPAKVPHQMKLAPGATVTYFVVKVNQ